MVVCGICHEEDLLEVGELDCCDHSFCFPCISRWAEIESRCPFCKARFSTVTHKLLGKGDPGDARRSQDDGQNSQDKVLEVHHIPERNQRVDAEGEEYYGSSDDEDPMDVVVCMECGSGDDESHLLLCDGCDNACHTYCAGLSDIPQDAWYCEACTGNVTSEDLLPPRRSQRRRISGPAAPNQDAASTEGQTTRRRRAVTASGAAISSPIDLTGSASPVAPRARRRRLQRLNGGPVGRRRGPTDAASVGDLLDALEARANIRTAHELPSTAHRNVENLRQNWDALRQGQMEFEPASASQPGASGVTGAGNTKDAVSDGEKAAWQAFEETRKARLVAREFERSSDSRSGHQGEESSTSAAAWGSDRREEIARSREIGRLLGPSGRVNQRHRRPSLRSRTGPLPLSRQPSGPSASATGPGRAERRSPNRDDALHSRQSTESGSARPGSARTAQLPRPLSGYRGRAASPPRLGRHSSTRVQPASSHRPILPLKRSSSVAVEPLPSGALPAQPAMPHPSATWRPHMSGHPPQPSGHPGPPAGSRQCWWDAASSTSFPAQQPPAAAVAAPGVSQYAAVYGRALHHPQQPSIHSTPPLHRDASSAPPLLGPHISVQPAVTTMPAAMASAGPTAPSAGTGGAPSNQPPAPGQSYIGHLSAQESAPRKSGSGSDGSSISAAAVGAREAATPPAYQFRPDCTSSPLPATPMGSMGSMHHLGTPQQQQGPEGSSLGTGGGRESRRITSSDHHRMARQGPNSKQQAFTEVKALLNPLLERRLVDREQFKAAAKAATHMVYRRKGSAVHGARPALGEVLAGMDLPHAAKAVLQSA